MNKLLLTFIILWNTFYLPALENVVFTPLDYRSGLSDNEIRNIKQLPDGRMIITTTERINIYDATNWKYLHYTTESTYTLDNYLGHVHEYFDNQDRLWIKDYKKLRVIDLLTEQFTDHPGEVLKTIGIEETVTDFFIDEDKNLWVTTANDQLLVKDQVTGQVIPFITKLSSLNTGPDHLYDLAVVNRQLFLFYRSGNMICLNRDSGEELYRKQIPGQEVLIKYDQSLFVIPGNEKIFQIRNGKGGILICYDSVSQEWETVLEEPYHLNDFSFDRHGNIWITCRYGLWYLTAGLTEKQHIPILTLVDGTVIDTEVSCVYNDQQGGLWLGTFNSGLLYYHPQRFRFINRGAVFFNPDPGSYFQVNCFTEESDNRIWIGTNQGLYIYDRDKTRIFLKNNLFKGLNCQTLFRDSKGRIWTWFRGEGLYRAENDIYRKYTFPFSDVYSIYESPERNLYLCTEGYGFGKFIPETGEYLRASFTNQTSALNTVRKVVQLSENELTGICRDGYFIYNNLTRKVSIYPTEHPVEDIYTDSRGIIWVASRDGLYIHNPVQDIKEVFYTSDGLIHNSAKSIIEAPDSTIWITGMNGISKIQINHTAHHYSLSSFNHYDGVLENPFASRAAFVSENGLMLWGGAYGFNEYKIPAVAEGQQPYTSFLTNFYINGVAYNKGPVYRAKEICLNHKQNFITFEFSAFNYINPTQTYYRYMLEDIDAEEIESSSVNGSGIATYTNLPPGRYTFRVRAAGNEKEWTGEYAVMKITIHPPFWKTTWAYILYGVLFISLFFFSIQAWMRYSQRKLMRQQKEKLDSMKAILFTNIKKELSAPLSKINEPLTSVLQHIEEGKAKKQLKKVETHVEELTSLVEEIPVHLLPPAPEESAELNMEVLITSVRHLLQQQEERRERLAQMEEEEPDVPILSPSDEKLIRKVLDLIHNNMDNPEYSVELLSRDMSMDRTGLYRKLVAIVGKTPTNLIRSVRLKRAAQLFEEEDLSVAEVADRVGFSTSSYLSKCFQEEFGMKPSQYITSLKKR